MPEVSEMLSISFTKNAPVKCPFRNSPMHSKSCACEGFNEIVACKHCEGSGYDRHAKAPCTPCSGRGCYPNFQSGKEKKTPKKGKKRESNFDIG